MCKVSIIIPVYNAHAFLQKCLDSCMNQTLQEIEVIAVNDASPDDSDLIMKEYELRYPNKFKGIYLKENIRQGGARNIGIRQAKGEYVTFVDSDDWIDNRMCEELYERAVAQCADVVYCNVHRIGTNCDHVSNRFPDEFTGEVCHRTIPGIIMNRTVGPWAHIIKRSMFEDEKCFFPEKMFCEDKAVTKLWDLKANRIEKVQGAYYYYRVNDNSTGGVMKKKYYPEIFKSIKMLYDNLRDCEVSKLYVDEIQIVCLYFMVTVMKQMNKCFNEEDKKTAYDDYVDIIEYIMGDNKQNEYIKRWFTPNERCMLENQIEPDKWEVQLDYAEYYQEHREKICGLFYDMNNDNVSNIGVWSNTVYAKAFQSVFADCIILDQNTLDMLEKVDCVVGLKSTHIANIKRYVSNKKIFDLESFLFTR